MIMRSSKIAKRCLAYACNISRSDLTASPNKSQLLPCKKPPYTQLSNSKIDCPYTFI